MIKKKQLQEQYNLSHNTVTETLKACGLDTSKREYSDEEINTLFLPARAMLDEGKTYDDVKAALSQYSQAVPAQADSTDSGEFAQQIAEEVEAETREIIHQVARKFLTRLPAFTMGVLNEMGRNNEVRAAYAHYRNQIQIEVSASTAALPPSEETQQN